MVLAAIVSAVLVGCASESTPRVPAPPPFVPRNVVVTLGEQGGATTLISTQSGGWTHNGQPFSSGGEVKGQNAATYRLTLSGDSWSASFVPPDPDRVRLGTSGDEVTLQMQENGSYLLGAAAIESGHVVRAGNGNQYRLTQALSGSWSAEFVPPEPLRLSLGTSGDAVDIEIREDQAYSLAGSQLQSGREVQAANGNRYTLLYGTDGKWRAMFVQPDPQRVGLGSSGRTVQVSKLENGTYQLAGGPLWTGEVRDTGGGATYRFSLGSDGLWSATYVAEPTTVHLGAHGGTIRVVRQESGLWTLGERTIRSGYEVEGSNGHRYLLTLEEGTWRADPQPLSIQVTLRGTGGSIFLTRLEDGTHYHAGTRVSSGDVIRVGGTNYRLTQLSSGNWRAALTSSPPGPPTRPPDPAQPLTSDTLVSYVGVSPRVRLTDEAGNGSREGPILSLNDLDYSVNALFTHGRDDRETTFAEQVRASITEELKDIETLIFISDSSRDLDTEIERRWDRIADHLDKLFPNEGSRLLGQNTPKLRNGRIDTEEVVEEIQDVLAALRTSTSFQNAIEDGIFSASRQVDADDSDDIFFAVSSVTKLGFGWTSATRYGAYSKQERSRSSDALRFPSGTAGIGAFAYSPWETTRTRELPSSGEAFYFGETIAAGRDSAQTIYTGEIELRVRFASRQVTALVSDLLDDRGIAWHYSLQSVDSIYLPTARLGASTASFAPTSTGTARITFNPISSRFASRTLGADFEGRFVGRGDAAGDAAIGTWSLTSRGDVILAGGFGANQESGPTRPPPVVRPPVDPSGDLGQEVETYINARPDGNGDIDLAARDSDNDRIEVPASELFTDGSAIVLGERLFDKARDDLQDRITLLGLYEDLFPSGSQALTNRQTQWTAANQTLEDNIFGDLNFNARNALGASYPSSGSSWSRRDEDAIELLTDARHALSSAANFQNAVEDDGLFDDILSPSKLENGDYDFGDIFAAVAYEVLVEYDHTAYTRFGAWAKVVRDDALSTPRVASGAERPDVFAYSPIGQTVYYSNDANFPRGFTSTYIGRTVAVDRSFSRALFYEGDISMSVRWNSSSPNGSRVTTVIENLARTDTGEPFLDNGFDVSHLIFASGSVTLDSQNNRIGFNGYSSVRVRYFDPGRREGYFGSGSTEGKFVGYHVSGPRAVIGTWEVGQMEGAFGGDLIP